jgi:NADH-quinone oxidoreductase subunit F
MDLDIMGSVCERIIGNCLCVLGDAMAMPIASMITRFRDEFEQHIERARERSERLVARAGSHAAPVAAGALAAPLSREGI